MADYNIYIHAIGTGGATNDNPTVPWSQRQGDGAFSQTSAQNNGSAFDNFSKAASYIQNPDALVGTGLSKIKEALPWVAAAFIVTKVATKVIDEALDYSVLESGYRLPQIQWDNLKTSVGNVFRPFSSTWNSWKTKVQWSLENQKREMNRELLGDSVINSLTGRGV